MVADCPPQAKPLLSRDCNAPSPESLQPSFKRNLPCGFSLVSKPPSPDCLLFLVPVCVRAGVCVCVRMCACVCVCLWLFLHLCRTFPDAHVPELKTRYGNRVKPLDRPRQVDSESAMLAPMDACASTRTGVYTRTCEPRYIPSLSLSLSLSLALDLSVSLSLSISPALCLYKTRVPSPVVCVLRRAGGSPMVWWWILGY